MLDWLKSKLSPKPPAPPPALSPLEAAKAHWDRRGRPADQVNALEELAACGGPEARAIIEGALKDLSSVHAQIAAARLLADLGDPASVPVLKQVADRAFWKDSEDARARGHTGMGMGPEAGRAAAQGNEKLVRQACENALKRLKG
jgi:HEAT repeat protein